MRLFIRVKARTREEKVEKIDETHYIVSVREPPIDDKANRAVIRALADFFQVPPSHMDIISGRSSKKKIVEMVSFMLVCIYV